MVKLTISSVVLEGKDMEIRCPPTTTVVESLSLMLNKVGERGSLICFRVNLNGPVFSHLQLTPTIFCEL